MKAHAFFATLACLVLTACATSTSPVITVPGPDRPNLTPHGSSVVDIHLVNETSDASIHFKTEWSYPAHPFWVDAHSRCVDRSKNWNTYIDFNHNHPQVRIHVFDYSDDNCKTGPFGRQESAYKDINLKDGRGLIQGKVTGNETAGYQLCTKQGNETQYHCEDLVGVR